MAKKLEEMTEQELLVKIVKTERHTRTYELIAAVAQLIIVIALIAICVMFIPKVTGMVETTEKTMEDLSTMSTSVTRSFDEIDASIDFDKLNQSIDDLAKVVGPLANAMSIFN